MIRHALRALLASSVFRCVLQAAQVCLQGPVSGAQSLRSFVPGKAPIGPAGTVVARAAYRWSRQDAASPWVPRVSREPAWLPQWRLTGPAPPLPGAAMAGRWRPPGGDCFLRRGTQAPWPLCAVATGKPPIGSRAQRSASGLRRSARTIPVRHARRAPREPRHARSAPVAPTAHGGGRVPAASC